MSRKPNRHLDRGDFHNRESYMKALWYAGGPPPGTSYDFSGAGEYEQLLAGIHGVNPRERAIADYNELISNQKSRYNCFVRKLQGRSVKPFFLDPTKPKPTLISVDEFASQHAAAQFAARNQLWCDTSVTIKWNLLGSSDAPAVKKTFRRFKERLNGWLAEAQIPTAYFYAHECGQNDGLHTHLQLYVPADGEIVRWQGRDRIASGLRKAFRHWVGKTWVKSRCGKHVPNAVYVNRHDKLYRGRHWIGFHYQLKGYDGEAVVVSAENSSDKRQLMLGDLLAFPWRNPGVVEGMKRVGYSRSLGPSCRTDGLPDGLEAPPPSEARTFELSGMLVQLPERTWRSRLPFQSSYEAGCRTVWGLYDPEFCERVTRLSVREVTLLWARETFGSHPFRADIIASLDTDYYLGL